jgi:hypothetical protein
MARIRDAKPVRLAHPRCPYCHDVVEPGVAQRACLACRAWHHEACWGEVPRCSACGQAHAAAPSVAGLRGGFRFLYLVTTLAVVALALVGTNLAGHALGLRGGPTMLAAWALATLLAWAWVLLLCRVTGLSVRELSDEVDGPPATRPQERAKE